MDMTKITLSKNELALVAKACLAYAASDDTDIDEMEVLDDLHFYLSGKLEEMEDEDND